MTRVLTVFGLLLLQTPEVGTQQPALAFGPSVATGTSLPAQGCPAQIYIRQYAQLNAASVYICDIATNTLRAPVLLQPLSGSAGFLPPPDQYMPPDPRLNPFLNDPTSPPQLRRPPAANPKR